MFADIQNLFLNEHGSFAKNLQFETIAIIVLTMCFITLSFPKNYGFIIILIVFAIYLGNTYVTIQNQRSNDFNKITMFRLRSLQAKINEHINIKMNIINNSNPIKLPKKDIDKMYKDNELDALYIDANMIHFLYSIIALSDFNSEEFYKLVKGTNNILRIQRDIERFYEANEEYPINTSEMFQSALDLRTNTINNLHNFVYTIPKMNAMYTYINDSINRYAVLASRITDKIHYYYKDNIKIRGINATTTFVTYDTTKAHDPHKSNYFYT